MLVQELVSNPVEYTTKKITKSKLSKIPHPSFQKKQQSNLFVNYTRKFNTNYNTQIYYNQENSSNFNTINTNNNISILPNNIESSLNTISYDTITPSFAEMEPEINIKLSICRNGTRN